MLIASFIEDYCSQIDFISTTTYYTYKNKKNSPIPFIKDIDSIDEINEDISRINVFFNNQDNIDFYNQLIKANFKNINCYVMQDFNADIKWIVINPGILNKVVLLWKMH